jgi:DNA-binding Lrp family transcriptional regulator
MKDLERRLLAELMKNSHRSDRQLAKAIGVSQPTVTRTINKLEKEGYIKEYTIIPDFSKLGYSIMGFTFVKQKDSLSKEEAKEVRKKTNQLERENPHADLIAVNGMGLNRNVAFVTFYEDYTAYVKAMRIVRQVPYADLDQVESFLVDLKDENHHRILSMSAIAHHVLNLGRRNKAS